MVIHQFHDKGLAHLSYAIEDSGEVLLIDPGRDTQPYIDFAIKHKAKIAGVVETHPHADFVSSHYEFHTFDVTIFCSKLIGASYPHRTFDDGDIIHLGQLTLKAINTPGHSPDSICVLLIDEAGNDHALFTGDTLFIGDVGRPDLRESAGNIKAAKEKLAGQLYHSLEKIKSLNDNVIIYPTHGAGSFCGKNISEALSDTLGNQKKENYALQEMDEVTFIKMLLENQPIIPKYFPYNVELNRNGAPPLEPSLRNIKVLEYINEFKANFLIIDTRPSEYFKQGFLKNSINIQNGLKFETWLGSIINPNEKFYIIAFTEQELDDILLKASKIGYELFIKGVFVQDEIMGNHEEELNTAIFNEHLTDYTIIDVRDQSEVNSDKIFSRSINIPLNELRERYEEIPSDKPLVVHCAAGYRSAIGSSLLRTKVKNKVYDLGTSIKTYMKQ